MRRATPLVAAIFFLSGVAGLVYQVVWTKALALRFGVTAYAVSTTVSVFMLGLALGSWLFGRRADRVRRPLAAYALLELGIGASALASIALLEGVELLLSSDRLPSLGGAGVVAVRTVGTFLVLLVPSTLMGGTMPMLAKELVARTGDAGRNVGVLYGLNALGGSTGCVLAGFVTIGSLGLRGSILVGVGLNGLAAILAFALARRAPPSEAAPDAAPTPTRAPAPALAPTSPMPLGFLAALFLAGVTGLGIEVVWTRMLLLNVSSTAQSFAAMLAVGLFGLAAGSLAASRVADRTDPVRGYAWTQSLVGLSILLCTLLWARVHPRSADVARWFVDLLPPGARGEAPYKLAFCTFQCALLLLVPTFLMGASFPFAGRCFGGHAAEAGRRLGAAFTVNTLGSMLGPLLAGFVCLPRLGIQTTVVGFATLSLATGAALAWPVRRGPARWAVAAVTGAVAVGAWLPPKDFVVASTYPRAEGRLLHYEEDVCGSVAVRELSAGGERIRQLLVGTTSMIGDGFNCRRYTRLLGHLPMLLHAAPRDALVICLGSGMTLSAVAAHPDVETIDCVELSPGVVRAARRWFAGANGGVLDDPRVRVIVNDGRSQLRVSRKAYDVIALEPPPPDRDGVAALYSREFYELCRARLRPGGVLSQWIPYHGASLPQIRSMLATFRAVFPRATLWELFDGREYAVVGFADDAPIPHERVSERLARPGVRTHLRAAGIRHPEDLFACFVAGPDGLGAFADSVPLVTDDRPGLGYDLEADNLVAPWSSRFERALQEASLATAAHAESPTSLLAFADDATRREFLARLEPVKGAWEMHALALRLGTLDPARHPAVFRRTFTPPSRLDPDNPYYRYAERRGVYAGAIARWLEFLRDEGR